MADRQEDSSSQNGRLVERRSVLKAVGGTAAALAFGTSVATAVGPRVSSADTVVDLGEEGLSSGDSIDPYLDEFFVSGTEVHIPPGEYDYSGDGLGGDKADCGLVGSPEGVVLHRPDDPGETVRPTTFAESGTVRVENLTIRGKHGEEQSRWRMGAAEDARMEVVNVNFPDGTVDGSDSTGIYAGDDHAGHLWVKSCYFSNFGNVALYVSDPYQGGNGPVVVEDCNFVNTGMSGLRFASDDSVARRCYFEATEKGPAGNTGYNQRGIKIDDAGEGVLLEDIDIYWTDAGTTPIQFDDKGEGGAGVMRNLRIHNESDNETFKIQWDDVADNWTGENINLSGGADHNAPDDFETATGDEATPPNREYSIWTPVDGDVSPGGPTDGADSSGEDGGGGTGNRLSVESSPDNPDSDFDVSFVVDGTVSFGDEAEADTDRITENGDGTYTATSVSLDPGAVDTYRFEGTVTEVSATDGYDFTLALDGEETTVAELTGSGDDGDGSGGSDESGSDTGGSGGGSDDGGGGDGTGDQSGNDDATADTTDARTLIIDGTGDAEETAKYRVSVTGTVESDPEQTTVNNGDVPWDQVRDHVGDGYAAGLVGNGQDAFTFTGILESVSVDGNAAVTILGE